MSKGDKRLEAMRRNIRSVRFEDLEKVLLDYGFEVSQPRGGSSHYKYTLGQYRIVMARHEPFIHYKTVKDALDALDEIIELE